MERLIRASGADRCLEKLNNYHARIVRLEIKWIHFQRFDSRGSGMPNVSRGTITRLSVKARNEDRISGSSQNQNLVLGLC